MKYPKRICRIFEPQYEATFIGVQHLAGEEEFPLYKFPGGVCCQDPFANGITILEW